MSSFLIRNSLNPGKVVKLSITFQQSVLKGDEGDHTWLVELATLEPHKNGGSITPEYIHLTALKDLNAEIEKVSEIISAQIDWTPLDNDTKAPYVLEYSPSEVTDVSINSPVVVVVKDALPSAGIDLSSVSVVINGFDETNRCHIEGEGFEYRITWRPPITTHDVY